MPIGVLTESKTKTLPKNGATLGRIPIERSKLTGINVDVDNTNENKTIEKIGIDEDKIVELTVALTDNVGIEGASLVVEEVIVSLVDEVLDTSIADT